ncbi:Oxidoreductase [Gaertneriomyces sp. JEL0708]|nr:Oxidoreductase [Gaertneriomyces sp. JEL0708]
MGAQDEKDTVIFVTKEELEEQSSSSSQEAPVDPMSPEGQAQAFNEETGEINWDCPCLEGMTKPPCGESFKAAFSCFVYSTEEPKGADCLDQFREMQKCFRDHPDIYGAELDDDDDDDEDEEENKSSDKGEDSAAAPERSVERTEAGADSAAVEPVAESTSKP